MNNAWSPEDRFQYGCLMLLKFVTAHNIKNDKERITFWCDFVVKCYDEIQAKETE